MPLAAAAAAVERWADATDDVQDERGMEDSKSGKLSAVEIGRKLQAHRARSPMEELKAAAGSSGAPKEPDALDERVDRMQARMLDQMVRLFQEMQDEQKDMIAGRLAAVNAQVDRVQVVADAASEVLANSSARVATVERDVDELRQLQDEVLQALAITNIGARGAERGAGRPGVGREVGGGADEDSRGVDPHCGERAAAPAGGSRGAT